MRRSGLGLDGEDEGGLEVEGVDLRVGLVEAEGVAGERSKLENLSVVAAMRKGKEGWWDGGFVLRSEQLGWRGWLGSPSGGFHDLMLLCL